MLYVVLTSTEKGRAVLTETMGGDSLLQSITEGLAIAQKLECPVQFDFNGRTIWLRGDEDAEQVYTSYLARLQQYPVIDHCGEKV